MINKNMDKYRLKWVEAVGKYMFRNHLTQGDIAFILGRKRTHLNGIFTGRDGRPLTSLIIYESIAKGICKVEDLLNEPIGSLAAPERQFWSQCMIAQREKIMALLGEAYLAGKLDFVENVLEELMHKK